LFLFSEITAAEEHIPEQTSEQTSSASNSVPHYAQQNKQIIERYRQILLRFPKRGVSFDKVFNSYSEINCIPLLLDSFTQLKTSAKTPLETANAEILLGLVYERYNENAKAAECFARAAELDKNSPTAPFYLAENLLALEKYSEAEVALKTALQHNPNRLEVLPVLRLLVGVLDKLEKYDEAITALRQALKIESEDEPALKSPDGQTPELLELLSKRAEQQGNLPAAIQEQEKLCGLYSRRTIRTESSAEKDALKKQLGRLLTLYIKNGDEKKSYQLFFNAVLSAESVSEQSGYIIKMLAAGQFQSVEKVLDFLEIHQKPDKRLDFCRLLLEYCRLCDK
jgi:tetratricopeptide (TPR) repeat protein